MPNTNNVDERIVEMRIDNEKFEAGAKKTLRILESLDDGLKGLSSQNVDGFEDIERSLGKVTDRFSAFGIVGDQVLRNLTNKAIDLVQQMHHVTTELTTQQIGAGWNKYAEKTSAVQTIMAATARYIGDKYEDEAEQMADVNAQLDKLNRFTDETSYNFLDMVNNIGKFTSAGRTLEESVTAMEGISTWAAISGANVNEASRAMYNLSQALSTGAVKLIDWKSIENANMATYEFKQTAIDTAVELGTLTKVSDDLYKTLDGHEVSVTNFNEYLKDNWFTSDVLLKTLNEYGEFTDVLLEVSEATGATATQILRVIDGTESSKSVINAVLPYMAELTKAEYDLGRRAFQAAQEAKTFKEAIDATKDAVSTSWMNIFEELFGNYLEAKKLWTDLANTLYDVFATPVNRILDIVSYIKDGTGDASGKVAKMGDAIGDFKNKLSKAGKTMKDFEKVLEQVGDQAALDLIENYGGVEEALKRGGISAELFRKALAALADQGQETQGTISLTKALAKAGKNMTDFSKAIERVADRAALDLIENYGGVEEALKRGGISAELFKRALESLGIDSENVSQDVKKQAVTATKSLDGMREVALKILSGELGNGEERRKLIEEMGLDYDLMQAMAGDLKNMGLYMSDEALIAAMEAYWNYNDYVEKFGYSSFAEYLATLEAANGELYTAEDLLYDAEDILKGMYGNITNAEGEIMGSGELFREGLKNIIGILDDLATAFDKAFLIIFGGTDDETAAIDALGERFWGLANGFYQFTESIKLTTDILDANGNVIGQDTTKLDKLTDILVAIASPIKFINSVLGIIFSAAKWGLGIIFKLVGSILPIIGSIFVILSTGLDYLINAVKNSPVLKILSMIGATIFGTIVTALEKLGAVFKTVSNLFKKGFKLDGIKGAWKSVSEGMDELFQNHPTFLNVFHAMEKVAGFVGSALQFVADGLLLVGGLIGGVFAGAFSVVIWVFERIKDGINYIADLINNSETLSTVFTSLKTKFKNFGAEVKKGFKSIKEAYQTSGLRGALDSLTTTFTNAFQKLFPEGSNLLTMFSNLGTSIETFVSGIWTSITGFKIDYDKIGQKFQKITNVVNAVVTGIFGDEEQRKQTKEKVEQFVLTVWEGFLAGLRQVKLTDVLAAFRLSLIASVLGKLVEAVTIFKQVGNEIKSIPQTFKGFLGTIGESIKSFAVSFQANALVKLALAIGILAGAMLMLSFIPEEKLTRVFAITAVLMLLLIQFAKVIAKTKIVEKGIGNIDIKNFQIIPEIAGILIGLSMLIGSIGIAVAAIAFIASKGGDVWKAAGVIAALVGGILAILGMFAWMSRAFEYDELASVGKNFTRLAGAMVIIAFAIQMMLIPIIALAALDAIKDDAGYSVLNLWKAVGIVAVTAAVLGGIVYILTKVMSKMQSNELLVIGPAMMRLAGAMVLIALAIQMMIVPIIAMAALEKTENFGGITGSVIATLSILFLFVAFIGSLLLGMAGIVSRKSEDHAKAISRALTKFGTAFLMIALSMRIISGAIGKIAAMSETMDDKHILRSMGYLLAVIGAFAAILFVLDRLNINGVNVLAIAGAIAALGLAILFFTPALYALVGGIVTLAAILPSIEGLSETLEDLAKLAKIVRRFAFAAFLLAAAAALLGVTLVVGGVGLLFFGGGLWILAFALDALRVSLPAFIDSMVELGGTMSEKGTWKKIGIAVAVLLGLSVAVALLAKSFSKFSKVDSIREFFKKLSWNAQLGMLKVTSTMQVAGQRLFANIGKFLQNPENRAGIVSAIEGLIVGLGLTAAGVMPTLVDTVSNSVIQLINTVADDVKAKSKEYGDAIRNMFTAIFALGEEVIKGIFSKETWDSLSKFQKGLALALGIGFSVKKIIGAIAFGSELLKNASMVRTLLGKISKTAAGSPDSATEAIGKIKDILASLSGDGSPTDEAVEAIQKMKDALGEVEGAAGASTTAATGMMGTYIAVALLGALAIGAFCYSLHELAKQAKEESDELNTTLYGEVNASIEKRAEQLDEISDKYDELIKKEEELKKKMLETEKSGDPEAYDEALDEYLDGAEDRITYINDVEVAYEQLARDMADALLPDAGTFKRTELARNILFEIKEAGGDMSQVPEYPQYLELIKEKEEELAKAASESNNLLNSTETEEKFALRSRQTTTAAQETTEAIEEEAGAIDKLNASLDQIKENPFGFLAERGMNLTDYLGVNGFDTGKLVEDLKAKGVGSDIVDFFENDVSSYITSGLGAGAEANADLAHPGFLNLFENLYDFSMTNPWMDAASPSKKYAELGGYIPAGIGVGVSDPKNQVLATTPIHQLLFNLYSIFAQSKQRFVAAGSNIVAGLIEGIAGNIQYAYISGQNLAASFDDGFRERLDIHSPSGVMYDNAYNTVLGTVHGYNDAVKANLLGTNSVTDSVVDVLYDKSKKLLLPFKAIMFGFNTRIKKTRKEIFDGLDTDVEGYLTAFERLAQKKEAIEQQINDLPENNYDERDRLHVITAQYDTLADILYNEFAYSLGLTTDEFYRQYNAAQGNIYEMERMKQLLGEVSTEAKSFSSVDTSMPVDTAGSSATEMYNNVVDPFEQIDKVFNDYGVDAAYGLVYGILARLYAVYESGGDLAAALQSGFTDTLLIESPSRVFKKLAGYIPLGIQQGIQDETGSAIDSVVVLGNELIDAIMNSMLMVSTVADEEFDFSPSITPVVDLNNVNAAAGAIGSAFGGNYSMSAQMTNDISRRMNDVERIASNMGSTQTVNNGDNIVFNIYQQPGEDPNAIADAVMVRMANRLARRGAAFG
jgi:tape measure domain-containing protein